MMKYVVAIIAEDNVEKLSICNIDRFNINLEVLNVFSHFIIN